jgi:hypothetical protein
MLDLKTLELTELLDMLSEQTYHYMKMLRDGASKEQFDICKQNILWIQEEIELRKTFESFNNKAKAV